MQDVALGFLWQDGDTGITERALEWIATLAPVYIVDLRAVGERFASLKDPRMHYAPFREKTSLGHALNRTLSLAYEDGRAWLWILDGRTDISREEVLHWTQKAESGIGLYRSKKAFGIPNFFSRPSCALLVSVAMARSLGAWNPVLPARQVFADFEVRLKAQGGRIEKRLKVRQIRSDAERPGFWGFLRRHFFRTGTKSR